MRKTDDKLARAVALALGATLPVAAAAPVIADDAVTAAAVTTEQGAATATYSRREALLASSDGRAVLHYGEGIYGADREAAFITGHDGIETYALPGGPAGGVQVFVNRKIYGTFNQDELNGSVVADAVFQAHGIEVNGVDPFARERPVASLGGAE